MGFSLSGVFKSITGIVGDVLGWVLGIEEPDIDQASGALVNKQSNIEPIPVIYGTRKVGGTRVFVSTGGGKKNEFLYVALALCEGEIEEIGDVYINDVLSTDSKYSGLVTIEKYVGTDNQTYSTLLSGADDTWSTNHRLRGVAYLAMRFKYDSDVFSSIPEVQAIVKGRKVYDPQTATTAWSNNPALCLRDYLTNSRYGKGLSSSLIDDTSFIAAKTFCNTTVTSSSGGAGTQKIFECNAIIDTSKNLFDNVKILLRGMRGLMPYSNGIYSLLIDKQESSSFDLTPDNITSQLQVTSQGKSRKYNKVIVKFANPEANWQTDTVFWPPAGSTEESTFLSEDNNQELSTEINLPTITNYYSARDIARVACLASRAGDLNVKVTATSEALKIAAGDVVRLEQPSMGWVDDGVTDARQLFRVIGLQLMDTGEVKLTLQKYSASIYTWAIGSVQPDNAATTLPDPFVVAPPTSVTTTETTTIAEDGTLLPSIKVAWTESDDAFVVRYEVQWKLTTDTEYSSAFTATTQYIIQGVIPGEDYDIRVRAYNDLNVKSAFATSSSSPVGDTIAPGIPTSVIAVGGLRQISLSWVPPTDPDYSHVQVYENDTDTFGTATKIAIATGDNYTRTGLNYDVTRYYWLKAVDYSGNISGATSSVNATTVLVGTDAFTAEVNNLFAEAGAYGIEPVATLPATGDFDGQIKYNTTENKLYRWDESGGVWTDDIFSITEASVDLASFASGIEPIGIVSSLPSPTGYTGAQVVFNTTDNKLYRYTGSAWTAAVSASDVSGTLDADNFPTTLRPVEIVGSLPTTGNFEGRQAYLTTDNKLYRYTGTAWTTAFSASDMTGTISSVQIANDAVTNAKLAVDSVQGDVIAAGAITTTKLPDGVISELKLANAAVTNAKLANAAVTADIIAANAITETKILSGAVTTLKLANDAVTNAKLATNAVQGDVIAANAITTTKISDSAISTAKLAAGAITAAKIAAGAVTADAIAANSVTTAKIAAGAVTADEIAANAITSAKIAAGTITAADIASNTITAAQLAAGSVTASEIAANAVTSDKITAGAITTSKLLVGGSGAALNSDPSMLDSTAWVRFNGTDGVFTTVTDGEVGSHVLRSGTPASQGSWYNGAERLALDPSKTYRMTAVARRSSTANGTLFVGVAAFDVNGSNITGDGTQWSYDAATNVSGSTEWIRYSMEFGAGTATTFPASAVTFAPLVILNYASTTGYYEAQDIRIEEKVPAELIVDGAITTDKLAANAVTAAKIAANTVTAAQIAAGTITASEIAANAVTSVKIAADAITAAKIAAGAVSTSELAAGAVTADKIAANSITAGQIAAGAITASELAANSVTAAAIAANAVTASELAADSVTAGAIAAGAVSTSELAANAVTAAKIAAGTITSDRIAAGTIQGDRIAASTITGGLIAATGIITSAAQINDAVVTNAKIANLAVDTLKIANNAVTIPEGVTGTGDISKTITYPSTAKPAAILVTGVARISMGGFSGNVYSASCTVSCGATSRTEAVSLRSGTSATIVVVLNVPASSMGATSSTVDLTAAGGTFGTVQSTSMVILGTKK